MIIIILYSIAAIQSVYTYIDACSKFGHYLSLLWFRQSAGTTTTTQHQKDPKTHHASSKIWVINFRKNPIYNEICTIKTALGLELNNLGLLIYDVTSASYIYIYIGYIFHNNGWIGFYPRVRIELIMKQCRSPMRLRVSYLQWKYKTHSTQHTAAYSGLHNTVLIMAQWLYVDTYTTWTN